MNNLSNLEWFNLTPGNIDISNSLARGGIVEYLKDGEKFKTLSSKFATPEMYQNFLLHLRNYLVKGMEGRGKKYGIDNDTWKVLGKMNPEQFVKSVYKHKKE